jgi:ABC-type transporter Mla subunit MlaD
MTSNKHAYKAGLFVLAGLVAIVVGTLVTTSRALFQTTIPIKSYFTRAVTGVARGTPVRYLGVTIGKVTDVGFPTDRFVYDEGAAKAGDFNRNVIVSMDIFVPDGQETDEVRREFAFGRNYGLCARVSTAGLTGLPYIELLHEPNQSLLSMPPEDMMKDDVVAIASTASKFDEMVDSIQAAVAKISRIDFAGLGVRIGELVDTADTAIKTDLHRTLTSISDTSDEVRAFLQSSDFKTTVKELPEAVATFRKTAEDIRMLARRAEGVVARGEPRIGALIEELTSAARSFEHLANQLERDAGSTLFAPPESASTPSKSSRSNKP